MSTFRPEIHGEPDRLLIEQWKGEGVRITYNGEVVVQGRSFGDVLKTLSQFFGAEITVIEPEQKP
jgi:hypothetical protein